MVVCFTAGWLLVECAAAHSIFDSLPENFMLQPEDAVFKPGAPWYDASSNRIEAHGGGIYIEAGVYYWVGESHKLSNSWDLSQGINLYSSPDLSVWTFHGMILNNKSMPCQAAEGHPFRIERPKIVKNAVTNKYVMWWHMDTQNFGIQSVGVATADVITGPWTFNSCFQPDGLASYDMGLFQDVDGSAYLVRSVKNQYAGISKLSPDYLNTTGIISSGPDIEGQAIFKDGSQYYLWGSHLTGWSANPAEFLVSNQSTLAGASWTYIGNPSNDGTTFDSQSTYILPYTHTDGHVTYIYMGDRWNINGPGGLPNATYIWLPLINGGNTWTMPWLDSWRLGDY